jgi:hypothetical protein
MNPLYPDIRYQLCPTTAVWISESLFLHFRVQPRSLIAFVYHACIVSNHILYLTFEVPNAIHILLEQTLPH